MNNKSKRLIDHRKCRADHTLIFRQWLAASVQPLVRRLQHRLGEAATLFCPPDFPHSMSPKLAPVRIIICTRSEVRRT
jgi:hypothetical protein